MDHSPLDTWPHCLFETKGHLCVLASCVTSRLPGGRPVPLKAKEEDICGCGSTGTKTPDWSVETATSSETTSNKASSTGASSSQTRAKSSQHLSGHGHTTRRLDKDQQHFEYQTLK